MILRTLFTAREIEATVHRLADEITRDQLGLPPAPVARGSGESSTGTRRKPKTSRRRAAPGGRSAEPQRSVAAEAMAAGHMPFGALGLKSAFRTELAPTLSAERPVLVGLLKGTYVFMADLTRAMPIPVDIDFMRVRVRLGGQVEPLAAQFDYEPQQSLEGRSVIIVEDVAGAGRTLPLVLARLQAHLPRSIRVCALVKRRGYSGPPLDYVGFEVGPGWIVGYGMDDREALRHLPGLCVLED